ncbi:hypothetical protein GCM10010994_38030 [Chelatococcus reniformis]|uniref:Uncharacterized protein n=1 Tax=Chelatococcus reniformis TaxID=1494448 RepID=A0A916ULF8_9HYPH|nr:hypothetical protein GCM10010994_38030 [Chelatococcus reniformis]
MPPKHLVQYDSVEDPAKAEVEQNARRDTRPAGGAFIAHPSTPLLTLSLQRLSQRLGHRRLKAMVKPRVPLTGAAATAGRKLISGADGLPCFDTQDQRLARVRRLRLDPS